MTRLLPWLFFLLTATIVTAADYDFLKNVPSQPATVDDRAITRKRLGEEMLRLQTSRYYGSMSSEMLDFEIRKTLDALIARLLLEKAAAAEKIAVSSDEIDQRVHEIYRKMSPQQKQLLHEKLRGQNQSLEEYGKTAATDPDTIFALQLRRLTDIRFPGKLQVSDAACEEYYRQNQAKFITPESVELSRILIPVNRPEPVNAKPTDPQQKEKKAAERVAAAFSALKAGEPFDEIARRYSDCPSARSGGRMGIFIRGGGLEPAVEKIAFELPENSISGIIRTSAGFEIIKINRVIPEGYTPFADIKDFIRESLQEDIINRLAARIVAQEKRRARIVINYQSGGNAP